MKISKFDNDNYKSNIYDIKNYKNSNSKSNIAHNDAIIANNLKNLRLNLAINIAEIAKKLKLSVSEISNYENNIKPIPASILSLFAIIYKVDIDYFYQGL